MRLVASMVSANFSKSMNGSKRSSGRLSLCRAILCSAKSIPSSESLNAGTNTGTLCSYAAFRIPRPGNVFRVPCVEDVVHHLFHMVEIRFWLQRIVNAVVSGVKEFPVIHLGVITEMRVTRGFHQPVSHERPGRDDGLDDARFNQVAEDKPHLANRQRARECHH